MATYEANMRKRLAANDLTVEGAVKIARLLLRQREILKRQRDRALTRLEQAEQFMVEVTEEDRLYVVHQAVWKRKAGDRWFRGEAPNIITPPPVVQTTARQGPT